jgi:hypothetical protein
MVCLLLWLGLPACVEWRLHRVVTQFRFKPLVSHNIYQISNSAKTFHIKKFTWLLLARRFLQAADAA